MFRLLIPLVLILGIACSSGGDGSVQPPSEDEDVEEMISAMPIPFYGTESLEESIASSTAIVRAELNSVSATSALYDYWGAGAPYHMGALEHRFDVLEYLKGTGDSQIVAMVYDPDYTYPVTARTQQEAVAIANQLLQERNTEWDSREAVLFLEDDPVQTGRYFLGVIAYNYGDTYTIEGKRSRTWLPADRDTPQGASGASETETATRRFLLEAPAPGDDAGGAGGASGASGPKTIALGEMKAKIASIEQEIASGGGTQAYRDCITYKYELERELAYEQAETGEANPYYQRFDESIESGLAAGTLAYKSYSSDLVAAVVEDEYGGVRPATSDESRLLGRDAHRFTYTWPGKAYTARPLPAGEYKFFHSWRSQTIIPCDGQPEELERQLEIFITVTAPSGTLLEALFDPAGLQDGVGFSADGGVLEPSRFTTFNTDTQITSLVATGDLVTMGLSPYVDLTFDTLDFIGLDGSVAVSLSDGTGDATAGTITWEATAPWSSGDQLMLRIVEGEGRPVPKLIASEVAPSPEVFFVIPSIGARLHWDEMDDLEGESVTGYTLQWSYEEDGIWLPATCSNSDQLQCWARWRDNDFGRGDTLYFRVIAHSETYDSMPSPVFEFTSR